MEGTVCTRKRFIAFLGEGQNMETQLIPCAENKEMHWNLLWDGLKIELKLMALFLSSSVVTLSESETGLIYNLCSNLYGQSTKEYHWYIPIH